MSATVSSPEVRGQTPLMRQYYAVKDRHPGTVLLFRMGDFYETFGEDAKQVHSVLGITLTKRSSGSASEIALAGFPYHALDTYLPKLVRAGFRVAICEQLEEPTKGKKIVDRDVVEIVTPGVTFRDQLLDPSRSTYLMSVAETKKGRGKKARIVYGISFADVSTGEFKLAEVDESGLGNMLRGIGPAEILCMPSLRPAIERLGYERAMITTLDDWAFGQDYTAGVLTNHFHVHSMKGFGVQDFPAGMVAAGALMHYLQETQKGRLPHFKSVELYDDTQFMSLDFQTLRNLELVSSTGGPEASLVSILDDTKTPMGARMLRKWLVRPLKVLAPILERQEVVNAFFSSRRIRHEIRRELGSVGDLERSAARICTGRASPRDLSGLRHACMVLPALYETLSAANVDSLLNLGNDISPLDDVKLLIETRLADEPGASLKEGHVIRSGYNAELDELRELARGGKQWLAELKESESRRTGIPSLKIGFNKVFGYYLEVTHTHKDKVPENYIRKQTLVNAERYITPELKEFEEQILGAQERLALLEARLFSELRDEVAKHSDRIQQNARTLARIDVLSTLAEISTALRFVCPLMHDGSDLEIEDGRHPVVERSLAPGDPFIPNSIRMSSDTEQILIITGPNMAGKSVVLRQVGLIVLLAQMGCFVPARRARIGLVDRIFTRVGASDNLAAGESTFLVEMNETANILNNATSKSLILLDEVGRGTSTTDGLSIAWALVEYLHTKASVAARTLFATHYHELNELENRLERVRNYRILVQEHNGKVVFLRKMVRGGADHSYGIEVARMAGLPSDLLDRSKQILNQLEQQQFEIGDSTERITPLEVREDVAGQMSLFVSEPDPRLQELADIIAQIEPESMTPIDALLLLTRLHQKMNES